MFIFQLEIEREQMAAIARKKEEIARTQSQLVGLPRIRYSEGNLTQKTTAIHILVNFVLFTLFLQSRALIAHLALRTIPQSPTPHYSLTYFADA